VEQFESILRSQTRPIPTEQLCDQAGIGFESGAMLAEALLLSDGLERESKGLRPKFIRHKGGFALAEREVSGEIISLEGQISDARDRLVRIVERQIQRKLRTLSMKAFVMTMVVYLQRTGFGAMKPVQRGGKGEFHMSVQDRRHDGRFRTAVVLRRDPAEAHLSDQTVIDLRGALHRYDSTSGIIATTGTVSDKAKVEAMVPNLAPVALLSGEMLARDMVQFGVGVRDRTVRFPSFDKGFFSLLES
jgi:restriction endonuclease Mrr